MTDLLQSSSPKQYGWALAASLALILVLLLVVHGYHNESTASDYDLKQAEERVANLAKLRAQDEKALTTAGWVDQDAKIVRLPITEAMSREVATLQAKPVQLGDSLPGITPPSAPPAPPATTAATNAAPAFQQAPATNIPPSAPAKPTK